MKRFCIAVTGASGSIYAVRLLEELSRSGSEIHLVCSPDGERVLEYETGLDLPALLQRVGTAALGQEEGTLRVHRPDDLFSPPASGSFPLDAMVIVPCSMATLGQIATGSGKGLIHRAADVCLKERRKLILVPRETPLSAIHLRGMLALTEAGALVLPAMPGFYGRPATAAEIVDFVVARILDHLGIRHDLVKPWGYE